MLDLKYYYNCPIKKNHYIQSNKQYLAKYENAGYDTTLGLLSQINNVKGFYSDDLTISFLMKVNKDFETMLKELNYIVITNTNTTSTALKRHYFVTEKRNISENVYQFTLELDVVNSYSTYFTNTKYHKNVKMIRRHKNRWKLFNSKYYRIFDKVDEGLGNVSTENVKSYSLSNSDIDYYIVTKGYSDLNTDTTQDGSYLLGPLELRNEIYSSNSTTLTCLSSHIGGSVAYSAPQFGLVLLTCDGTITGTVTVPGVGTRKVCAKAVCIYSTGNLHRCAVGYLDKETFTPTLDFGFNNTVGLTTMTFDVYGEGKITAYTCNSARDRSDTLEVGKAYIYDKLGSDNDYLCKKSTAPETFTSSVVSVYYQLSSINSVNKIDSNIKNIEMLPFSLTSMTRGYYSPTFGATLSNSTKITELYQTTFDNLGETFTLKSINNNLVIDRDINYESKMYGSYVLNRQLIYDSFSLPLQVEYFGMNYTDFDVYFYKPLDMTGNLAIQCQNIWSQSYLDNTLTLSRNNNVTIYSNEYLEYVRNGYNYDQKAQSLNKLKMGLDIANTAVSAGLSIASGGTLAPILMQTTASTVRSTVNNALSEQQNQMSLQQKRTSMLTASPTLCGGSSVEMFSVINNGNRVKYVRSEPSDTMKNSIYNMFYFYGYADNLFYEDMPSLKTRKYFNYLQCDVENCTITNAIIKDRVVNALKEGVVFEWQFNDTWLSVNNKLYENFEEEF